MNRSILIVIVDFLLVSLMAFSNLDNLTLEPNERRLEVAPVTSQVGGKQDLVGTLKLALDTEQQSREKLTDELAKAREAAALQVADRDSKLQEVQENLLRSEAEARQLEQQRALLQQQISGAHTNLQSFQTALSATRSEAKLAREQL